MSRDLVIGMAGSGGDGIVSAGESLFSAAAAQGYHAILTKSFGSQIRGGESSCRVRVALDPLHNPGGLLDVAIALSWSDFRKFGAELPLGPATLLVHDAADPAPALDLAARPGPPPAELRPVPFGALAREATGTEKAKNSVILGLLCGWLDLDPGALTAGMTRRWADKGQALLDANLRALFAGIRHAAANPLDTPRHLERPTHPPVAARLTLDGNDMCAAAAIRAGCEVFSGYPITPSSEVMQHLADKLWLYGGAMLQAEDEIAGIGVALGASFAGKKAMTATSGPGLSLKTEMLGLASIAELPLVILDVQRGGPSTGTPTKPEQSDLFHAALGGHGDTLRPVLAPTSVADTFRVTVEAFNLAELYQTPVLLLSDQEVAQRKETVDRLDPNLTHLPPIATRRLPTGPELDPYIRFLDTPSGVSPIAHPGLASGNYLASGIEHTERGAPTVSGEVHASMTAKRFRKLDPLQTRRDLFHIEGPPDAPLALIAWGSVAGVCRETLALARSRALPVKLLVPLLLYPIAVPIYRDFLATVVAGLVVEQSHQGQLHRLLRMALDLPPGLTPLTRPGASPFRPDEVLAALAALTPTATSAGAQP